MKLYFILLTFIFSSIVYSQDLKLPVDTLITSSHTTKIKNATVDYLASTGTQPVWDSKGKVIASLYYTYYKRTDVKKTTERPLVISFNGGPGSASVWMHIAYTGPKILKIDSEGFPVQPYGVKDNPYSIF